MFSTNNNNTNSQAQAGPDLEEVTTEALGFSSIAGETKIRLLPSPWPTDALPQPTSSLLSIASQNELLAAAGPDCLVIGSTQVVREAFVKNGPAENNVKNFEPQLKISVPRVSQVAFSSDESFLTICAAEGGGLAVYDVQALKQGTTEPAFQIATNGIQIRALVPNPALENAHLQAVVLGNGQLMVANLKTREFVQGVNGLALHEGVSCVSWSSKGKQLVAGLGSGKGAQLTPEGALKAEIPRSPQLQGDQHISGISWLNNDTFCIIYTPTQPPHDQAPESTCVLCTRQKNTSNYQFQKFGEICPPFGMNRLPPHHFLSRLHKYPPNLADTLILSSTASPEISLITCSSVALSKDASAANTANKYTLAAMAIDSRRAQMPVSEDMGDTSPIGMALDLSSKEPVKRPIPGEEIDATQTPLPALMILNNEGVLCAWWFVYNESVRQGQPYPGLSAVSGGQQQPTPSQPQNGPAQTASFGQSAFGASNALGQQTSTFGGSSLNTATPASTFGLGSAFGSASTLGASKSAWNPVSINSSTSNQTSSASTGAAFGKPAFGSATPMGPGSSFGAAGAMGKSQSPWAATGTQQQSTESSSQPKPFSNTSAASPFATFGNSASTSDAKPFSPFSNTSTTSPFATVSNASGAKSVFGALSTSGATPGFSNQPSFGSTVTIGSSLGSSSFGAPSAFSGKSPWDTPSLSNNPSALSGQFGRSDNHSADADMDSGDMDRDDNKNEQEPTQTTAKKSEEAPKSLFGGNASGFQLKSSFVPDKSDGFTDAKSNTTRDGNNLFGSSFGNLLNDVEKGANTQGTVASNTEPEQKAKPDAKSDLEPNPALQQKPESEEPKTKQEGKPSLKSDTRVPTAKSVEEKPTATSTTGPSSEKEEEPSTEPVVTIEPAPLPPSPKVAATERQPQPAPLPSSPKAEDKPADEGSPQLSPAGTPPIDLGADGSSPLSSSHSTPDRNSADAEEAFDEAPLPPDFTAEKPAWQLPSALPKPRSPPKSPVIHSPVSIPAVTPTASIGEPSATPFSATKPPVFFSQPDAVSQSPRSPSPVRRARMNAGQRSLSSPSPHRTVSQPNTTTPMAPPPVKSLHSNATPQGFSTHAFVSSPSRLNPIVESRSSDSLAIEALDDSDRRIQQELSSPLEATRHLAPFLAHQDYVGKLSGQGIPVQVEKIYRDISSMIDTLGLNSRSLAAFTKGHSEISYDRDRDRSDLEKDEGWCLQEIDDLALLQKELSERLESDRPQDIEQKVEELIEMQRELTKLRTRNHDVQKTISEHVNPDEDGDRPKTLTAEQSSVLLDLRRDFQKFQKLLSEAEDAVALLKARLASVQARGGAPNSAGTPQVPTVEAVLNTIAKMTRMVEQKSGDLDFLDSQLKHLIKSRKQRPDSSSGLGASTLDLALSKMSLGSVTTTGDEGRLFTTPPSSKRRNGTFALTYSPDSSEDEGTPHRNRLRNSLILSASKSRQDSGLISDDHLKACMARKYRRDNVLGLLKSRICERGTKITVLNGQ